MIIPLLRDTMPMACRSSSKNVNYTNVFIALPFFTKFKCRLPQS